MQHPDEGTIHTWLDGELKADEAAALEAHVAECGDCAARAAEARGLVAASSRIVSSLDIAPADVIPVWRPITHAWYANTRLHAAAAILIVAGTSFFVLRNGDEASLPRIMDRRIQAAAANTDSVENQKEVAGASAPESPVSNALRGKVSGAAAPPPSGRVASPVGVGTSRIPMTSAVKRVAAADAVSSPQTARTDSNTRAEAAMSTVVSRGVAAAPANSAVGPLSVVKSDTTANIVVTVYAVAPDVEVTLSETARSAFALPSRETARLKTQVGGARPSPPTAIARRARIESITWTNYSTGRTYILSGALSKDELTSIRSRLPSGVR